MASKCSPNISPGLKERWTSLFGHVSGTADTISDWWDYIERHYSEKARHYHTLHHVASMFTLMDNIVLRLSSPKAVSLAIFFHDVIYNPMACDNEEKSGDAFMEFSAAHLKDEETLVRDVYDWILLTKTHVTPEHGDRFGNEDRHYFLDIDMQVLGWPDSEYRVYADQIRQEYIHIPDQGFRSGRAQVLKKFLERPRIYATQLFHEEYEEQARRNISDEIKRLEAG